uniref:Peptidase metallopeptidase domain-containing protein n=1 Tax=Periophthalmus magnuspinnatus TaxID=409849 RepID=A0A3B3ZCJ2_9GOBI
MLTFIQRRSCYFVFLAFLILWTSISSDAERLFHQRDHSDLQSLNQHQAQPITDPHTAELFLSKYGFLKPVNWEEFLHEEPDEPDFSFLEFSELNIEEGFATPRSRDANLQNDQKLHDPQFITALRDFQRLSGLPVTGVFDEATKKAMNQPRCGVPDIEAEIATYPEEDTENYETENSDSSEVTETGRNSAVRRRKRHLATAVSKRRRSGRDVGVGYMAFSKTVLRWRLIGEGYSSQLSVEEQRYVFRLAFRMWSEVCPLEFIEDTASPLEEVDIRLGFGTGRHLGCKQRFDGSGREFAHAWFLGDIHFDDDEHFTGPNAGKGISLLKVAVHEIGHVLGLPHIHRPGSIMQPSYLPHESSFEVDWMDRKAIQDLYGEKNGFRIQPPVKCLFVKKSSGTPKLPSPQTRPPAPPVGSQGVPRPYLYFYSLLPGSQFWRYDSDQDQVFRRDPEGVTYPRLISEGFPGVPSPIDTAVFDRRDGNIYFFKGALVYPFSVDSRRVARGYPRPLRSVFPPLDPRDHPESHLDAAYFSYSHNALFLFKDTSFWQVASVRERRRRPHLPKNSLLPQRQIHEQWFDICNVHPTSLKLNP